MRRIPPPALDEYVAETSRACFLCEIAAGRDTRHAIVYEDELAIAFLNRFPSLYGYVIVAPREHREQVTGDFSEDEYAALQRVVHRVGEALRRAVPTERLYVLSLGSQQGNRHVHWHLAPLPPGVPIERQQLVALSWEDGVLELSERERGELADDLVRVYREHNEPLHAELQACEGILEVLPALRRRGARLGIVTAKRLATVRLAFEVIPELEPNFDVVVGADETERH